MVTGAEWSAEAALKRGEQNDRERGMMRQVIRLGLNDDNTVDEVVAHGAFVHLEDLGDAYMLIVETADEHVHVTIPARKRRGAFVYEQYEHDMTMMREREIRYFMGTSTTTRVLPVAEGVSDRDVAEIAVRLTGLVYERGVTPWRTVPLANKSTEPVPGSAFNAITDRSTT